MKTESLIIYIIAGLVGVSGFVSLYWDKEGSYLGACVVAVFGLCWCGVFLSCDDRVEEPLSQFT